ncbi:MAG: hypothetical protein Alis3KO_29130 [Aliiglaciecola sp.]
MMTIKHLLGTVAVASAALLVSACSEQKAPESLAQAPQQEVKSLSFPDIYNDYLNRDVRDDIFYFVMPDRFYNANPNNDNGSTVHEVSQGGYVIDSKWGFHGGDMQGIEEKLDYLKGLGVSAIWMTPILRNDAVQWGGYAHHGYWIVDFTEIDPHFGSNDDLKNLIEAAHDKGIKIFFDIITNHTADIIRYEECHKPDGSFRDEETCPYKTLEQLANGDKYTPFLPAGTENVKVPKWLNDPKYYNNQGDSFWQGESAINGDFVGLDDLNTRHPDVIAGMIDIYKNIITEFKPDGFRVDTVKHVDMIFWSQFSPAIMNHAKEMGIPNFHIFGEVYSADPIELSSYTTEGKMPSVLDFGFQQAAADVFYRDNSPVSIAQLFENDDYYNDHDSQADLLMNFLGNHDMGRAGFFIEDGMGDISEQEKLQRSILSHAFMYLSRGIPVIYYGDEQGFTGDGGDVGARENMFSSQVEEYNDNNLLGTNATTADNNFDPIHPIYQALQEFAQLRMDHVALRRGVNINRYFDERRKAFAIARVDTQEQIEHLVAFNADTEQQKLTLNASSAGYKWLAGNNEFRLDKGKIEITLPPLSYTLLKAETPVRHVALLEFDFGGVEKQDGRIRFDYLVAQAKDLAMPLFNFTTEFKNAEGQFEVVAQDNTSPYSAIVTQSVFEEYNPTEVRVTMADWQGNKKSQTFSLADQTVQTNQ